MPPLSGPSDHVKAAAMTSAAQLVLAAVSAGRDVPEPLRYMQDLAHQFGVEKAILTVAQGLIGEAKKYNW
ncbi:MAG: hypothetical protein NTW19_21275 [Planctomycetota bacterium]|nr:hypothetical protein [Planctomycetota bacterium]